MTSIKDPNERVAVNIQIPAALKEKMNKAAVACGMSFSTFARTSFHLCAHFDPAFWTTIQHLAEIYGVGESKVISNIVARYVDDMKNQAGLGNEEKSETVEQ